MFCSHSRDVSGIKLLVFTKEVRGYLEPKKCVHSDLWAWPFCISIYDIFWLERNVRGGEYLYDLHHDLYHYFLQKLIFKTWHNRELLLGGGRRRECVKEKILHLCKLKKNPEKDIFMTYYRFLRHVILIISRQFQKMK